MLEYWKSQHSARDFTPGGMYVKNNFCYIPIPKNSSSYIGQLLIQNGWQVSNFLTCDLTDKNIIVLIREPIDRWISAMAEYLLLVLPDGHISKHYNELVQNIVFDQIVFDDHTEKQIYFIQGVPELNCVFLNSSKNPELAIKKYLNNYGEDLNIDKDIDQHRSQDNNSKVSIIKFLQDNMTTEFINKLKKTYKEDYNLWNVTI